MKKTIPLLILVLVSFSSFSQKKIQTVILDNGKQIIIYDNKTWEYDKETKSTSTSESNSFYSSPSPKKSKARSSSSYKSSYSSTCGALTKKGGSCRRIVSGGGRCWQHGG